MNIETTFKHNADNIDTACGLDGEREFMKDTIFELSEQLKNKKISETLENIIVKTRQHLGIKEVNSIWKDEMLAVCIAFKYGQLLSQLKNTIEDGKLQVLKELLGMIKDFQKPEDKE